MPRVKRQPTNGRMIANHVFDKGVISRTHRKLLIFNNNNNKITIQNAQRTSTDIFLKINKWPIST